MAAGYPFRNLSSSQQRLRLKQKRWLLWLRVRDVLRDDGHRSDEVQYLVPFKISKIVQNEFEFFFLIWNEWKLTGRWAPADAAMNRTNAMIHFIFLFQFCLFRYSFGTRTLVGLSQRSELQTSDVCSTKRSACLYIAGRYPNDNERKSEQKIKKRTKKKLSANGYVWNDPANERRGKFLRFWYPPPLDLTVRPTDKHTNTQTHTHTHERERERKSNTHLPDGSYPKKKKKTKEIKEIEKKQKSQSSSSAAMYIRENNFQNHVHYWIIIFSPPRNHLKIYYTLYRDS